MIAIVDYGLSNLLSIKRAVSLFSNDVFVTSVPNDLDRADKIILPGVGAFGYGMTRLKKSGLKDSITAAVAKGIPLLGICLGMQMLLTDSDEGGHHDGLNLIDGSVKLIPGLDVYGNKQDVPHIGWNALMPYCRDRRSAILNNLNSGDEVYFVHSYEVILNDSENGIAFAEYGGRKINAIIQKDNIVGCQFHPEKSGEIGLQILSNFVNNF